MREPTREQRAAIERLGLTFGSVLVGVPAPDGTVTVRPCIDEIPTECVITLGEDGQPTESWLLEQVA